MKTFTNTSKNARTLARTWDDETGVYDYFFLSATGGRRYKVVTLTGAGQHDCAAGNTYDAGSWYGHQVRKGELTGKFSFRETDVSADIWTQVLQPGESVVLPTHCETYHQHAMRTGEFRPRFNRLFARQG